LTTADRGQVWLVQLPDPENTVGREQAGTRSALVLSSYRFNSNELNLVVVVPITTANRPFPSHVPVRSPEGGLREDSFIMCEQVKSISNERLVREFGTVEETTMSKVEEIVADILELGF
jgi:mRNA interferase MazF